MADGPDPLATAAAGGLAFSALSLLWSALIVAVVALSTLAVAAALERWRPLRLAASPRYRREVAFALTLLGAGWTFYLAGIGIPLEARALALALGTAGFAWRARRVPALPGGPAR